MAEQAAKEVASLCFESSKKGSILHSSIAMLSKMLLKVEVVGEWW